MKSILVYVLLVTLLGIAFAQTKKDCLGSKFLTAAANGEITCVPCPLGYFNDKPNARECMPCPAGSYGTKDKGCVKCAKGQYALVAGATQCFPCALHTYSNLTSGATICIPCEGDTYTTTVGSSSCVKCAVGHQPTNVKGVCKACEPGTYNNVEGAMCKPCAKGTTTWASGGTECFNCKPGTFWVAKDGNRHSQCKPCPDAHYSAFTASSCTKCPPGFVHNEISGSCVPVNSEKGGKSSTIGGSKGATANTKRTGSWSFFSVVYMSVAFAIFYLVTDFLLQKIDEMLLNNGALMKITLVVCMVFAGQILPFDADAYLLAYAGIMRIDQFSNWLHLGVSAFHMTVIRAAVALFAALMYGSFLIVVAEAGFVAYYFYRTKA